MSSEAQKEAPKPNTGEEEGIPDDLLKNLRKGDTAESGSSNGENNSDNSALVSIGNTSFGFNFDSEEHTNSDRNENSEDSDGNDQRATSKTAQTTAEGTSSGTSGGSAIPTVPAPQKMNMHGGLKVSVSSITTSSGSGGGTTARSSPSDEAQPPELQSSHTAAAADAVASLKEIATTNTTAATATVGSSQAPPASTAPSPLTATSVLATQLAAAPPSSGAPSAMAAAAMNAALMAFATPGSPTSGRKRKADEGDSSAGYHTDDEGRSVTMPSGASSVQDDGQGKGKGKKKKLDEKKREERNLREKERSLRISKQINELRNLLSSGGVIVPKGTKSSVLTEAANYIRMLQQHQYRSELDRHQLIQQMQMIGNGAHGSQAARAVRHVAAQNGVWSLGNFGGIPPKSAMSFYQSEQSSGASPEEQGSANAVSNPNKIDTSEYKFVFNSCGVGMAIASLGGAFIDCNQLFCQLSNFTKQEVCGLTIFNLTSRQDLQHAFDLISQMISPPLESRNQEPKPIVLRGSMKNRTDIGLCISLVKGDDGIAKCFCATLIKNPTSPFDTAKPIPVSFDAIQQTVQTPMTTNKPDPSINSAAPAFTLG
mmetsp:Transcript_13066/g.29637  ORF Transcript_13066/g.29637 Transcript_13066/m.29637 type:complete len:597 (-) Transcript_13066:324-2114(-)